MSQHETLSPNPAANWIRQYILFHGKRHPTEMGAAEVSAFLTHLAVKRQVAASTQNQALAALLFLYKNVLKEELPWLKNVERAKRPVRIPLVLRSRSKAPAHTIGATELAPSESALWSRTAPQGMSKFASERSGFRLSAIAVRDAKGHTDRVTMLPASAAEALRHNLPMPKGCTCETSLMGLAESICPLRWRGNTRTQIVNVQKHPIRLRGHLFFDGSHHPCGDPNMTNRDPLRRSNWEIHPVYSMDVCSNTTLAGCSADNETVWTAFDHWIVAQ